MSKKIIHETESKLQNIVLYMTLSDFTEFGMYTDNSIVRDIELSITEPDIGKLGDNIDLLKQLNHLPFYNYNAGYLKNKDNKYKIGFLFVHPLLMLEGPKEITFTVNNSVIETEFIEDKIKEEKIILE
jgi:hypothetical protein